MAGGSLTISVSSYAQLKQVAQAVTCWAGGPGGTLVRQISTTSNGPVTAIRIPEELNTIGALTLKRGGANLWSGYIVGSDAVYNAANGTVMGINANTCPARTDQPTVTSFAVAGTTATMVYANVAAAGTVDIFWGDGLSTLGAAESGTEVHAYGRKGTFTVTITDVSTPANTGSFTVVV